MKLFELLPNKRTDITNLADLIESSIEKIDENLSVHDFAKAVAFVLIDCYGEDNFKPFIKTLKENL